jgi:hypothetical protein
MQKIALKCPPTCTKQAGQSAPENKIDAAVEVSERCRQGDDPCEAPPRIAGAK